MAFLSAFLLVCCEKPAERQSSIDRLPYYNEATFTPHWLDPDSDSLNQFHTIAPFKLLNQDGDTITEKSLQGKIFITDFFFTTCPGICPRMTTNMAVLQEAFLHDADVMLLSHSVTPERDSVAVLKNYAKVKGVKSGKWHLLTGDRQQIYHLGRKQYFVEEDLGLEKEADDFLHTENFILVDKNRHIRGIYNGLNKTSINQLIDDVKTLKAKK
ncbi:MAG: SCO family protein [Saprospiraceae bacterium]|nr:MAG: SCO family protein [Saprospiraceae bacterium]